MPEEKEVKKAKKKVLIVDYGSKSAQNLRSLYESHQEKAGVGYEIDVKTEEDILKLKKKDPEGKELKEYDIIHQSGSRVRNLGEEAAKYLMQGSNNDTYMLGTCHGAQEIAKFHGVEAKKLAEHQKGKKEIDYKGQKRHIHKHHSWGIPVGNDSKLEAIATSQQKFHDGSEGKIYEVFRVKGKKHIGIQGHGEQGVGKEIMYETLDQIHGSQQKKYKKD